MNTTHRLLGPDGFARPSTSLAPLPDVDIADARLRVGPIAIPAALGRLRLKEWEHYCLLTPGKLVTLAIVDVRYLKLAWVQIVDTETGTRIEHRRQTPFARTRIARALWDDRSAFDTSGFSIRIHDHLDAGEHRVEVDIAASAQGPPFRASWRCVHDLDKVQPVAATMPVGPDRCAYSHKVALPCEGTMTLGADTTRWALTDSIAILDIHKAHYPRHTFWKWATCAGHDAQGRLVAVNLTKNVVRDDTTHNENSLWVDGGVTRLGPAVLEHDLDRVTRPWSVSSADGRVALTFTALGARSENTNIPGLARSRFHQLYGRFNGTVSTGAETIEVRDFWGLCEDHDSIW